MALIAKTPAFIDEMEHLELRSHDFIQITPERLGYVRDFSTLIAVGISVVVLSFYKYERFQQEDGSYDLTTFINPNAELMMNYLGYI